MITAGLVTLINYATHLTPGVLLFGLWFRLTPRALPAIRIFILLAAFVLMRDVMTPLGMWALTSQVQIAFTRNAFVLATLGGLSVLLIILLARIAPELWRLMRWTLGNPVVGVAVGLGVFARHAVAGLPRYRSVRDPRLLGLAAGHGGTGLWCQCVGGGAVSRVFAGLSGATSHAVTGGLDQRRGVCGLPYLPGLERHSTGLAGVAFTLIEGLACALVRMRYGVLPATLTHGTAILLIAVPLI